MEELKQRIRDWALEILEKRFDRLEGRRFVLFPVLRARLLLRKISKLG